MSELKIGSNIASLNAQRRLGETMTSLSEVYKRLSSGQRINSAADDAAGLAISSDLNVKSRVFAQAIRNINDGISVFAIADAAVEALITINTRLQELAEQSANGTYSNEQRAALNNEGQELAKEYFRVSRSAAFNGQRLFDGSLSDGLRIQLGFGVSGSIQSAVGGKLGTGGLTLTGVLDAETSRTLASQLGDLNGDGFLDLVTAGTDGSDGFATVRLGYGDGTFGQSTSFATENKVSQALALGDINGDGLLDLVTAGQTFANTGFATVRLGLGNGSFGSATSYATENNESRGVSLGDLNGDGNLDLVTAGAVVGNDGYATVRFGTGNGSFAQSTASYATEDFASYALTLGDVNNDRILDLVTAGRSDGSDGFATIRLGTGNGSFGQATSFASESYFSNAVTLGDLNGDGNLDLVTAGTDDTFSDGYATVRLGNGNGSFRAATSYLAETGISMGLTLGDLNGDGMSDLVTSGYSGASAYDGYITVRLGGGSGTFGGAVSTRILSAGSARVNSVNAGDLNGDGVFDIVAAGYDTPSGSDGKAGILLGQFRDGISPLQPFKLSTKADSLQAISSFANNQRNLSALRGQIGATQSRLSAAMGAISSARENFVSAESRITDADVAQDSSQLIRTQILQQATSAILAQANQQPRIALTLLS